MNQKQFLIIFSILIIFIGIVYFIFAQSSTTQPQKIAPTTLPEQIPSITQDVENELELSDKINVFSPRPNQKISSPLKVTGEARGTWYFEAQASTKLLDENNTVLATGIITANGEWMTENFVPFTGELTFQTPSTKRGTLILEKANPSGLPENEEKLIIPVQFK